MSGEQRPLLAATIGPIPAMMLDREAGEWLRRQARQLEANGQSDAARQVFAAAAQLRESRRQLVERTSFSGNGELPEPAGGSEFESPPGPAEWWSTEVAAERLGVTSRQVRNLARDGGPLSASTKGGRMYIDPVSVIREQQRRQGEDR